MGKKRSPAYWRNYLLKVKRVNEIYIEHNKRGVFAENIYRMHIRDQFLISRSTFFAYLSVPYKKKLAELDQPAEQNREA